MISYAQNAEDVVLARAFAGQTWGFYVDVGANHPEWDSVTRHFYARGWRGVNIEPMPREHLLLLEQRPGDVNLQVAVGAAPGRAVLHQTPLANRGSSTLRPDVADEYRRSGQHLDPVHVEVTTLAEVCDRWVPGVVDFLKVDVEGFEHEVLRGADWQRFRPRVVVVEAVDPLTHEPSHGAWEPLLLEAGYRVSLFDGLNRFYVRQEEPELLARLAAPANVLDGYRTLREATLEAVGRRCLARLEDALTELREQLPPAPVDR